MGCFLLVVFVGGGFLHSQPQILDEEVIWISELRLAKPQQGTQSKKVAVAKKVPEKKPPTVRLAPEREQKKPREVVKLPSKQKQPPAKKPKEQKDSAAKARKQRMREALADLGRDIRQPQQQVNDDSVAASALSRGVQELVFRKQIQRRIESNLYVTSYDWYGKYKNRMVEYQFYLNSAGEIVRLKQRRSSGVPSIDQNVLEAIRRSQPFLAPNAEIMRRYAREPVVIQFSPGKLRLQ